VKNTLAIFKRELGGYFATPVAYVFIVVFLLLMGSFTFYLGDFYDAERADLRSFFGLHPFTGIALFLTVPMWITVNYLGDPDNGVILASYLGSFLMAGGYLAIGACISASTKNQVIAFVVSVVVCIAFVLAGLPIVLNAVSGWAPDAVVEAVRSFSFLAHFDSITKGVIDFRDFTFFASLIALCLFANAVLLEMKKAD
jgi:ABC-2 type transport system permease protein